MTSLWWYLARPTRAPTARRLRWALVLAGALLTPALSCSEIKLDPRDSGRDDSDDSSPDDTGSLLDTDNDTIPDRVEGSSDPDSDGLPSMQDLDSDGDTIPDAIEAGDANLETEPVDTDNDLVPDFLDPDSDNDTLIDRVEALDGESPVDTDSDGLPDYRDTDSDQDEIPDIQEYHNDKAGNPGDTDSDGLPDYRDTDSDSDRLEDSLELSTGTDPYELDSDLDGVEDGVERALGTDPLDPADLPADWLELTLQESATELLELSFQPEIRRFDLALLLDTSASMSGVAGALGLEYGALVTDLLERMPDGAFGLATFEDYPLAPYGASGDLPFRLLQQLSPDSGLVEIALYTAGLRAGGDTPDALFEAVHQAASGAGWDLGCDGVFHAETDIPPFLASSSDPFGGSGGQAWDPTTKQAGTLGGVGFRDGALPILLLLTDAPSHDPDLGEATPGGCPTDAGLSLASESLSALEARLVGVDLGGGAATADLQQLAQGAGTLGDLDGDGDWDDPWVKTSTRDGATMATTIREAVLDLPESSLFENASIQALDPQGFLIGSSPELYANVRPLTSSLLSFSLELQGTVSALEEERLYGLSVELIGDGQVALGTRAVLVRVPGSGSSSR